MTVPAKRSAPGYFSRLWSAVTGRSQTVSGLTWDQIFGPDLFGARSDAGVSVTSSSALSVSAWWRAIGLRGSSVGKATPPRLRRRTDGGFEDAKDHPAWAALRTFRDMTAYHFYSTRIAQKASIGNGLALIVRDAGRLEMIPLDPTKVVPFREDGVFKYLYTSEQLGSRKLLGSDVVHFKGPSSDGLWGDSVVSKARDTLGLSIAMRTHGSKFFANGARLGVILEHPGTMSPEAQTRFLSSWSKAREGVDQAWKTVILEEGMKASAPLTMTAEDAQLIESHAFTNREIGNFTGVPPSKLGDVATKTYGSVEMDEQAFVNDTVEADLIEAEQELARKLLTPAEFESGEYCVEFDRDRLVSVNTKDQAEADKAALAGMPWKTKNEVRAKRGLNPVAGGDVIDVPINLSAPGGKAPADPAPVPPADPGPLRSVAATVTADARRRMARRLGAQARKAAKVSATFPEFLAAVQRENDAVVREAFGPAAACAAALDGRASDLHVALLAGDLFRSVREALDGVYSTAKPDEFAAKIDAAMSALEA